MEGTARHFPVKTQNVFWSEMGQARQGFSTHRHGKPGQTGGEGGLSALQAHRSTQTGEVRLPSLQSKDLVHTGSAGLSYLSVEHGRPLDQRDSSGLRRHTAHLYHTPAESGEKRGAPAHTVPTPSLQSTGRGARRGRTLLSICRIHPEGLGEAQQPSASLACACRELLPQRPPAVISSRPPRVSQTHRWTPMTSNIIPHSEHNRIT